MVEHNISLHFYDEDGEHADDENVGVYWIGSPNWWMHSYAEHENRGQATRFAIVQAVIQKLEAEK